VTFKTPDSFKLLFWRNLEVYPWCWQAQSAPYSVFLSPL